MQTHRVSVFFKFVCVFRWCVVFKQKLVGFVISRASGVTLVAAFLGVVLSSTAVAQTPPTNTTVADRTYPPATAFLRERGQVIHNSIERITARLRGRDAPRYRGDGRVFNFSFLHGDLLNGSVEWRLWGNQMGEFLREYSFSVLQSINGDVFFEQGRERRHFRWNRAAGYFERQDGSSERLIPNIFEEDSSGRALGFCSFFLKDRFNVRSDVELYFKIFETHPSASLASTPDPLVFTRRMLSPYSFFTRMLRWQQATGAEGQVRTLALRAHTPVTTAADMVRLLGLNSEHQEVQCSRLGYDDYQVALAWRLTASQIISNGVDTGNSAPRTFSENFMENGRPRRRTFVITEMLSYREQPLQSYNFHPPALFRAGDAPSQSSRIVSGYTICHHVTD